MSAERLTVPALVRRRAAEQPEKPFVVTDDDVLTYGELDRETAVVATRFAGVGKGTRVGVLMPNGTAWPVVALGVARAGGTVVPLSTLLRPPELAAQLHTAGVEHLVMVRTFRGRDYLADLAVISPELAPGTGRFVDVLPRLRSITEWDADRRVPTDDDVDREPADARDAAIRPADDLAIVFTSGSRGRPKGVIHTHAGALGATEAGLEVRRLGRDDRLYIPMPFFWVGGFGTGLLSALVAGATLLTEAVPEPARTLAFLERERVTLFRGWPDQAAALARDPRFADADLDSLRPGSLDAVLPAGRRVPAAARVNLLGMTESFGPYVGERLDQPLPAGKEGSCGRAFEGIEIRIVDVETGTPVGPDELGEIQLRGPNLMRGICGRPRADVFTADEFYPTGDLGRLDADGYLYLTGRRDDMFKVRGATVYPSEVERALHGIRGVQRAFVVDIVQDGSTAVAAAVIATPDRALTVDELEAEARARLSAFKVPTRWRLVAAEDVPMTTTGKVDKTALQQLLG
jgi:acyl-CoA synthetase (AMP-forming)/AMP-acid ligase II